MAATGSIQTNDSNVRLGSRDGTAGKEFNGQLDEVRIYSVALTAEEVVRLAASK